MTGRLDGFVVMSCRARRHLTARFLCGFPCLVQEAQAEHDAGAGQAQGEGHPDTGQAAVHDEAEEVAGRQGNDEVGDEGVQHHDFDVEDAAQGVGEGDLEAVAELVEHHG